MAEGLNAKGIFNGDWNKLTGTGSAKDPLLYNGKRFTGTVRWNDGPANYANGVLVRATKAEGARVDENVAPETVPNQPVIADVPVTPEEVPPAGLTPEQAEAAGKAFGFMKAFLDKYPNDTNLQLSWARLLANDIAGAKLAFQSSDYYANTSTTSDQRIKRKLNQFGVYTQELNNFIDEQVRRLVGVGITLDSNNAKVREILEAAYLNGDSDNQIDIKALAFNSGKTIGGTTGASIADLRAYARAFGIKYSDKDFARWSEDVFAGRTTAFDIQAKIRQDSASMFPAYSQAILDGESVDSLGSGYKSSIATILEIDPDSIDWTEPALRKALQYTENGKPAVMPNWMFEQQLRQDPRWQFTNNARDSIYNAIYQVRSDMGLI